MNIPVVGLFSRYRYKARVVVPMAQHGPDSDCLHNYNSIWHVKNRFMDKITDVNRL